MESDLGWRALQQSHSVNTNLYILEYRKGREWEERMGGGEKGGFLSWINDTCILPVS